MQSQIDLLTSTPSMEFAEYCSRELVNTFAANPGLSMRSLIGILALKFSDLQLKQPAVTSIRKRELKKSAAPVQKPSGPVEIREMKRPTPTPSKGFRAFFEENKDKFPDLEGKQLSMKVNHLWQKLSSDERIPYAEQDDASVSSTEKVRKPRRELKPKSEKPRYINPNPTPSKGFKPFFEENKHQFPDLEGKQLSMAVNHLWQKLSPDERTPYSTMADVEEVIRDEEVVQDGEEEEEEEEA